MTGKTDELLAAMGIGTTAAPPTSTTAPLYAGRLLSTVEPEHVQWLWQDWLPLGALTVLDGIPGAGKSTIMYDLAARVSTGRPMPTGPQDHRSPAGVVLLTAEDPLAPVVRPRLDAAGADPARVFALQGAARPTDTGEMVYGPS
ncbi:MAG: AAA family ATPase [Acidimicrobiales bacterium]